MIMALAMVSRQLEKKTWFDNTQKRNNKTEVKVHLQCACIKLVCLQGFLVLQINSGPRFLDQISNIEIVFDTELKNLSNEFMQIV